MSAVPINIINFAPRSVGEHVHRYICELGHPVQVLGPEALDYVSSDQLDGILVVALSYPDPDNRMWQLLDNASPRPRLGILHRHPGNWDPHISDYYADVCFWPCTKQELEYRIAWLCSRFPYPVKTPELERDLLKLNFIGSSPAFSSVVEKIRKFAHCDASVLIEGETGTGKELAARALHYFGPRKSHPFVPVNCGALPENLIENELFGHRRGAYTDARTDQSGLVAQAQGGTLFLDEVDALTPSSQASLLRFLQNFDYRPLGGERTEQADLRIIAASNQPITQLVERNLFRGDLYYRINIISLQMPALWERRSDIPALTRHFLGRFRQQYGKTNKYLTPPSLQALETRDWPGNIRELENYLHRAFIMSDGDTIQLDPDSDPCALWDDAIDIDSVPNGELGEPNFATAKAKVVEEFERRYLKRLLAETGGNVSQAARFAGKERRAFGKLLRKHRIDRHHFAKSMAGPIGTAGL